MANEWHLAAEEERILAQQKAAKAVSDPIIPAGPEGDAARADIRELNLRRYRSNLRREVEEQKLILARGPRLSALIACPPPVGTPEYEELVTLLESRLRELEQQSGGAVCQGRHGAYSEVESRVLDLIALEGVVAYLGAHFRR